MIRVLTLATLLYAFGAMAAINANMIVLPDLGSRAILTRQALSNIIVGSHGNVSYLQGSQLGGGSATTWQRTYIAATNSSASFQQPVTVSATAYDGVATNWLRFDAATNLPDEYAQIQFPNGANSTVTNCLVGALRSYSITNTTGSDVSLDTIILYDNAGGAWAVVQLQATNSSGGIAIRAHAASGGTSAFGPFITIIQGKIYFIEFYRDSIGGRCCVRVYDPLNWQLVGESICAMNTGNTYLMEFPVGYIGNIPQDMYQGPTFVIFDATDSTYTSLITQPSAVINSATIGAAHLGQ